MSNNINPTKKQLLKYMLEYNNAYNAIIPKEYIHTEQRKEYSKRYYQLHKKEMNEKNKAYRKKNYEKNLEYSRMYMNKWTKKPKNRIDCSMGGMVRQSLKNKQVGVSWKSLVSYTLDDLVKHLESLFEPWMTWDNYGQWEIDHIKPKSLFHYETAEDSEFKECWSLKNLQSLEKIENRKKYNHYILI